MGTLVHVLVALACAGVHPASATPICEWLAALARVPGKGTGGSAGDGPDGFRPCTSMPAIEQMRNAHGVEVLSRCAAPFNDKDAAHALAADTIAAVAACGHPDFQTMRGDPTAPLPWLGTSASGGFIAFLSTEPVLRPPLPTVLDWRADLKPSLLDLPAATVELVLMVANPVPGWIPR